MSKSQTMKLFVTERLTAVAEAIFMLFERTIAEYEDELRSSRNENQTIRRALEALNPRVLLSRHGAEVLPSTSPGPGLYHGMSEEIKKEPVEQLFMSGPECDAVYRMKEEPSQLQIQTEHKEGTPGVSSGDEEYTDHSSDWERPISCKDRKEEVDKQAQIRDGSTGAQNSGLSPGNTSAPGTSSALNDGNVSEADEAERKKNRRQEIGKEKLLQRFKLLSGEKPYTCSECAKRFTDISVLNRHIRTHTREKPYSCSQCDKRFNLNSSLSVHMRTHAGEKPYRCSHCNERFELKNVLKIHMRTHVEEKPYSCSQCGKRFSQSSALKRHTSTHAGEKPFSCSC